MSIKEKFRLKGLNRQQQIVWGAFCVLIAILLFTAFVSFFQTWKIDQSAIGELSNRDIPVKNSIRKLGASLSHLFIYKGVGVGAFFIAFMILVTGVSHFINSGTNKLGIRWIWTLLLSLWSSVGLALILPKHPLLSGVTGFEANALMVHYIGPLGVASILLLIAVAFLVYQLKWKPENLRFPSKKTPSPNVVEDEVTEVSFDSPDTEKEHTVLEEDKPEPIKKSASMGDDVALSVTETEEDEIVKKAKKLVADFGEVDPTLELKKFPLPHRVVTKKLSARRHYH